MRKVSNICFSILAFLSILSSIDAQNISINPISSIEDLPSRSVQRILQDSDGFLWFGTLDGLCRYDAYRILVFRSDMNNPNLLTNNEITCLAEDKKHNIWIGTKEGLNILNKETFQITHFNDEDLRAKFINYIVAASDGTVWVGSENKLYCYNISLGTKEDMTEKLSSNRAISYIYEDKHGDIWVSCWNAGLHKYKKDGTFIHYPVIGKNNNPVRIFHDNKNQYWICTWGEGLFRFFPNSNPESMYVKQDVYNIDGQHLEDTFFSIVQDDYFGYIWVMSFTGLYALKYLPDNTIRQVPISDLLKNTNKIFSELIKDRCGNLWIASFDEGAFTINFDKPDIVNIELSNLTDKLGATPNITSIYEDNTGMLWLNQNRFGLCTYSPQTKTITKFSDYPALKNIPGMKNIACISGIKNRNDIWLGAHDDEPLIYILDRNKTDISIKKQINLNDINSSAGNIRLFFEDSKNNIWITTTSTVFVKPYNSENIKLFSTELNSAITAVTEDINGAIWMSSESKGIYKIEFPENGDLSEPKIKNYSKKGKELISDNITSGYAGTDGKIWFGTYEGNIIVYDGAQETFKDYTMSCKMRGEAIQHIVVDEFNNVWITTNKKITKYNPKNGASRNYSTTDGLFVNSFYKGAIFFNKTKNRIYFGGNQGICLFTPVNENINMIKMPVVLVSDVKVQGQSVISNKDAAKFKAMSQRLSLDSNDKNIEIDFTSLNYTYSGKILYAYKMEGIDDDWVYTNGDRQFAMYNTLKKGTHIFHVKATDENRLWSSETTTFIIYKQPAFYETWWAYIIYFAFILSCAYIAFRIIQNRITLKNKLKITQIEKDKSEELTQTKLRYFTNISHDFLTPLTIIQCLIDDIEAASKKKILQLDIMKSNVNRLRRLLQQVLDFRKVESGNLKLKVSNGDISTFIQDICYNNFTPLINKKKINFTFESEPAQIQAYFDADKIDKIIYNLLSNALKYTPAKGCVNLRLQIFIKENHPCLAIRISDTGIGIHPDDINNIFKRFYYNKNIDAGQTNGIGLSLSRDLVELHHGTISVESELNIGTVFNIEIPIDEDSFSAKELNKNTVATPIIEEFDNIVKKGISIDENEDIAKENINILLVEDNEDILYTIKNILLKRYNVFTATNGFIALNIIKTNDIDIIVSDVMMPEMDGLELCRTLKNNIETSHISVLLLTAKNSVEDRIECYDAGADGYISKPFEIKVLVSRINNFLINKKNKQAKFKSNVEINIATLNYPSIDEQFLDNAVKIIEKHLSQTDFDINIFAQFLNMSKSSLYRKIRTMTGLPPNEFIRNIRLKHACQLLKDRSISISEVAYAVGFTDQRYFAKCFKTEFNMTPTEYQKTVW
ncbi:two-component regulator propeller domain-containing protein [Dysgonomonas reticulitermitis]